MITKSEAAQRVLRFSGLPGFPTTEEGQDELVDAMRELAEDADHADRMVRKWWKLSSFCPTPHDLYQMAPSVRPEPTETHDADCSECEGSGWKRGTVARTIAGETITYPTVERCECGA